MYIYHHYKRAKMRAKAVYVIEPDSCYDSPEYVPLTGAPQTIGGP